MIPKEANRIGFFARVPSSVYYCQPLNPSKIRIFGFPAHSGLGVFPLKLTVLNRDFSRDCY